MAKKNYIELTDELRVALKTCGSTDPDIALAAQTNFVQALELPLKMGEFDDDHWSDIFSSEVVENTGGVRYPLDFVVPGDEADFAAFDMPHQGAIPQRHIEGDELIVHTYEVANAIDWSLRYARDARWPVIERAIQVFRKGFTRKHNTDAWNLITTAAANRAITTNDSGASSGVFTPKLVAKMKTQQKRSAVEHMLTDLYVSPEAFEDMRAWTLTEIDDLTRREIWVTEERTGLVGFYGVRLHELIHLGLDSGAHATYQDYFINTAGGSLASGDAELVIGIDKSRNDSFVNPIIEEMQMFPDPTLHRSRKMGFYGSLEMGMAVVDQTRTLAGSF